MFGQKLGDLGFDRLGQQGARTIAQDLGQLVSEDPWLNQLKHVIVRHGVSLLQWRSGGSNTPTIRRLIDSRCHQLSAIAHVAMRCLAHQPDQRRAKSTITAALVRMDGVISADPYATIGR
jgi:hypothetical protein